MIVEPFKAEHLDTMDLQPAQKDALSFIPAKQYKALEGPTAFSLFANGECVACVGAVEAWPNRAQVWTLISGKAGKHMKSITGAIKRMLTIAPWRRIEAQVDCDFAQGHRWMRMLGFSMEVERMTAYLPDGRDAAQYVRLR